MQRNGKSWCDAFKKSHYSDDYLKKVSFPGKDLYPTCNTIRIQQHAKDWPIFCPNDKINIL